MEYASRLRANHSQRRAVEPAHPKAPALVRRGHTCRPPAPARRNPHERGITRASSGHLSVAASSRLATLRTNLNAPDRRLPMSRHRISLFVLRRELERTANRACAGELPASKAPARTPTVRKLA